MAMLLKSHSPFQRRIVNGYDTRHGPWELNEATRTLLDRSVRNYVAGAPYSLEPPRSSIKIQKRPLQCAELLRYAPLTSAPKCSFLFSDKQEPRTLPGLSLCLQKKLRTQNRSPRPAYETAFLHSLNSARADARYSSLFAYFL